MRIRQSHSLRIGGVHIRVSEPQHPEKVPKSFASELGLTQDCLGHLRWLVQKDSLGQDSFLIGPPGSTRRRIALAYAELTGREVEFLTLSQDTTEADLKQRREIVDGSAIFVDQAPVRAAIEVTYPLSYQLNYLGSDIDR
jgi:von Willebrand factor A domain-containing protein 8